MTPRPSRFARWPRAAAAAVLALLATLMIAGIAAAPVPINAQAAEAAARPGQGGADAALYRTIVAGMRTGGGYYPVAARSLRDGGFPLRPFLAFRLPTLASLLAAVPPMAARAAMLLLIAGVIAAWTMRLGEVFAAPAALAAASLLVLAGVIAAAQPDMIVFHEIWAALLIALSLALRRDRAWAASLAIGLGAALIRETAIAYLLAMAVLALVEGRRREAAGWAAGIAVFALFLAWHAGQVAGVTGPADPASPGWGGLGGWPFLLSSVRLTGAFALLPPWTVAMLLPLALLGWIGCRARFAWRVAAMLLGYAAMVMLFARPDNFYWSLLLGPLLPLGLAFAPAALIDLLRSLRPLDSGTAARQ